MKCDIQRVAASELSWEEFDQRFGSTELPVIITGCETSQQAAAGTLWHEFIDADSRDIGWYDAPMPAADDEPLNLIPSLVSQTLERPDAMVRPKPMRLWMQPAHHKTLLHYDGNSLCGFNLQVMGKKSWTLISPNTELAAAPFNFVMLVGRNFEPDSNHCDVYNFTTEPGDMLFLPRYWVHSVETLSDVNMNVNWVWTPDQPEPTSALGEREVELLRLRRMVPLVDYLVGDKTSTYGGAGEPLVNTYVCDVSASRALARFAKEIANLPLMMWRLPSILKELKMFSDNNFHASTVVASPQNATETSTDRGFTTTEGECMVDNVVAIRRSESVEADVASARTDSQPEPNKRSVADKFELAWISWGVFYSVLRFAIAWGGFSAHGANPWIFGIIDIGTAFPYAKSTATLARRVAEPKKMNIVTPLVIAVTTFFAPMPISGLPPARCRADYESA